MKVPSGRYCIPPSAPISLLCGLIDTTSNCAPIGDCALEAVTRAVVNNVTSHAHRNITESAMYFMPVAFWTVDRWLRWPASAVPYGQTSNRRTLKSAREIRRHQRHKEASLDGIDERMP